MIANFQHYQKLLILGVCLLVTLNLSAQKLDKKEKKMVQYVDEHIDEAILSLIHI